jgi:hypothetical protein
VGPAQLNGWDCHDPAWTGFLRADDRCLSHHPYGSGFKNGAMDFGFRSDRPRRTHPAVGDGPGRQFAPNDPSIPAHVVYGKCDA